MRKRFSEDPDWYLKYRKAIEYEMSDFFLVHRNTPALEAANKVRSTQFSLFGVILM